jgi:hypothetical protein
LELLKQVKSSPPGKIQVHDRKIPRLMGRKVKSLLRVVRLTDDDPRELDLKNPPQPSMNDRVIVHHKYLHTLTTCGKEAVPG